MAPRPGGAAYATDAMSSVDEIRYCAMGIRCERYDTRSHKSDEFLDAKQNRGDTITVTH